MRIFDTEPRPGMPVRAKMFFTALIRMARAWEKLAVHNGHVDWANGIPTIVIDDISAQAGGGVDYDMYFVGGRKYLGAAITGTPTNFLQVNADGTAEWVAAMPDVMPTGSEVYDVTKNHIHITGATAGNI